VTTGAPILVQREASRACAAAGAVTTGAPILVRRQAPPASAAVAT